MVSLNHSKMGCMKAGVSPSVMFILMKPLYATISEFGAMKIPIL
jgi:hypothetical protein